MPSVRVAPAIGSGWIGAQYSADVSAVIVNYNTRAMLQQTLATLDHAPCRSSLEVIVVDNASADRSVDMVRARFPRVQLLANNKNLGHTGGSNQGMALATGRYLFLLNPDTIVPGVAIDILVEYLDAHTEVGAVGPRVLNADGSTQGSVKQLPTPAAALFGRYSLLTRLFPHNRFSRRYLVYLDQDFSRPFRAGSVSGCALMVRREAIEAAGPMDTGYFMYWNDVDWCHAIWQAGYQVHCVPAASIVHDEHQGGTRASRRQRMASILDFHCGAYRYYRKWHVQRPWHANHLAAITGLAARALLVLMIEQLRWALSTRREVI